MKLTFTPEPATIESFAKELDDLEATEYENLGNHGWPEKVRSATATITSQLVSRCLWDGLPEGDYPLDAEVPESVFWQARRFLKPDTPAEQQEIYDVLAEGVRSAYEFQGALHQEVKYFIERARAIINAMLIDGYLASREVKNVPHELQEPLVHKKVDYAMSTFGAVLKVRDMDTLGQLHFCADETLSEEAGQIVSPRLRRIAQYNVHVSSVLRDMVLTMLRKQPEEIANDAALEGVIRYLETEHLENVAALSTLFRDSYGQCMRAEPIMIRSSAINFTANCLSSMRTTQNV